MKCIGYKTFFKDISIGGFTDIVSAAIYKIPICIGRKLTYKIIEATPKEILEENFDIEVNRYMLVNFQAFANLVDAVGGVNLELSNEEVQYVNGYLVEYNQLFLHH